MLTLVICNNQPQAAMCYFSKTCRPVYFMENDKNYFSNFFFCSFIIKKIS